MAKLINFMQGDSGMIITVDISDGKKKPLEIAYNAKVKGHLQKPDGTCTDIDDEYITITNRKELTVRITIAPIFTEEEGFYQIFLSVITDTYNISATKSIDYYVTARHNIGKH